jgi:RHH-type transcriptional regulator, proline utilization regulon repressor / proline dehydrogenase / delta 1-pyrroline-5-carboxylate dehydrogenase
MSTWSIESRIQTIGQELAQLSAGLGPGLFESRWWSQAAINLAMKDEAFKAQLFRFVDVLPALRDDAQVTAVAREYFGNMSEQIFGSHWGWKAVTATTLGAKLSGKTIRRQVEHMAEIFIAGSTIGSALPRLARLWSEGRASSVDLLGEATLSDREADSYRDQCGAALQALSTASASWQPMPLLERDHLGSLPRTQLSLKISALHAQLDPADPDGSYEAVARRLRPLLDLGRSLPASIIFDMEQAETKDLIVSIFMRLLSEDTYRAYPHAGLALQAYRPDTAQDVEHLITWVRRRGVPVTIRLVKGAYWDSDTIRYRQRGWPVPLFEAKALTDMSFERLVRRLLEHTDVIRPAFGTHNLRSLAVVEATAESLKLTPDSWEYQMIFGMAEPFQMAVAARERRLRIYTPVGELLPGMAYLVRRLLENTSNESFLRKEHAESQPLSVLLAPPAPQAKAPPVDLGRVETVSQGNPPDFRNEPPSDFSQHATRQAMEQAISRVSGQLNHGWSATLPTQASPSGDDLITRNPADPSQVVAQMRGYAPSDIPALIETAAKRRKEWEAAPVESRIAVLRKAAALMRERRYDLAAWELFEEGKPWHEADADVAEAIDFLEFYAADMARVAGPRRLGDAPGELNHRLLSPRGVAAVIAPWNFPLAIPTGMVSAALVTGNTVLFKPSERSVMVGQLLAALLSEAGLPAGVLQFVPGGPEAGKALVTAPEVATVAFTGSKDVGLWILQQAGSSVSPGQRLIKRVIAEMGGKNAVIVDDTADLDEAVAGIVSSFTGYAGQKCSACSRAIVHEAVYDVFIRRLTEAVMSVRIGAPQHPGTQMGPLIDERALTRVRHYIDIGKQEGHLLIERETRNSGYYAGPAVFADIRPEHRLAQEEIFGPVLAVMKARSFEEAITMANTTSYALTGGLYSRTPSHVEQARLEFDVGNLYINRPITGALVGRQPFGGHRLSGVGAKAGGEDYLSQFMITRVVSENTLRRGFAPAE